MWTVFSIFLLLLSVAFFVFRRAFPIPWFARYCYWWGGGFLFLFLAVQLFFWLRPAPVPLSPNEAGAVRDALASAIERAERSGVSVPATAAVVHFSSDPTDEATEALRGELAARAGWTPVSGSPAVAFLKGVAKALYEATSVDEYLLPGRRVGIDVVFYGTLRGVSSSNGVGRALLSVSAYDTRSGRTVFSDEFAGEYPRVRTAVGRAVVAKPRSARWWIFAIFAILLPWILAPLSARVLSLRSNAANAGVLAALVALDLLAGALLFYDIGSRSLAAAGVALLCVAYDLVCCEFISRRATLR